MSVASPAGAETARARPLSGGLWTLLSWLRRDDSGSSDSLSSVGSDRTVASFAFLSPDHYRQHPAPLFLPPAGPPTDSYKRRVRDRNLRLQHDRDLTLHRKYGLFRGENSGYDAFSLPSARRAASEKRERQERERRATSECLQRRAPHVPGKRRAPPPPLPRAATLGAQRRSRKRPAPQPPRRPLAEIIRNNTILEDEVLTQMNAKLSQDDQPLPKTDASDCKPEKYIKKEVKDPKVRTEKSFLKQIFENRKRNSAVDTIPERILPSISELDKQAADIIESCKLKALDQGNESIKGNHRELQPRSKGDMWFCTRCLRKYNDSVVTCVYCVTKEKMKLNKKPNESDNNEGKYSNKSANCALNHCTQTETTCVASTSRVTGVDEKQKLKEMLKELKDSLPIKAKHDAKKSNNLDNNSTNNNDNNSINNDDNNSSKAPVIDAPTLRIGSGIYEENVKPTNQSAEINTKTETNRNGVKVVENSKTTFVTETAVVTQPIVLQHLPSRDIVKLEDFKVSDFNIKSRTKLSEADGKELKEIGQNKGPRISNIPKNSNRNNNEPPFTNFNHLNTPLKISSLLNSNPSAEKDTARSLYFSQFVHQHQPQTECSIPTKPVVSSHLQEGTVLNPKSNPNFTAFAAKVVHNDNFIFKEQPLRKTTKATSTTQTSEAPMVSSSKLKQNLFSTKDSPKNDGINSKTVKQEADIPIKTVVPINSITNAVCSPTSSSFGTSPSAISESLNKPINGKETKGNTENLNLNVTDHNKTDQLQKPTRNLSNELEDSEISPVLDNTKREAASNIAIFDQHSKRRDLINQLEQSIAKGDERAAAEAAAKLAQLRLSCSVLSFSSQIVGAASTSSANESNRHTHNVAEPTKLKPQPIIAKNLQKVVAEIPSTSKTSDEKKLILAQPQFRDFEKQKLQASNNHTKITVRSTSKLDDELRNENDMVPIEVWIEDKEAARGPIRMNMPRVSVMGDLRRHAHASLGLAAHLQRWIVGRTLCTDDNTPLNTLAGPNFDAPFYLCLVEPETNKHPATRPTVSSHSPAKKESIDRTNGNNLTDVYSELVLLERRALVPNAEEFECGVCMEQYTAGQGAVLRECVHTFCRNCLSDVVKYCEEAAVCCPATGCPGTLQEREIRALVSPEEYEKWLARGLAAAESGTRNAFHCRTRDCIGWALCDPGVTRFPCPVCKRTNCVSCQAIHEGDTCEQYRAKQQQATEATNETTAKTDEGTKAFLDTLISRGEALECPECSAIITKKWGCDWIKCSACKTEICWVTRGRRWGPGGRGDTSAGCRCGVDGKRCHPSCGYCH